MYNTIINLISKNALSKVSRPKFKNIPKNDFHTLYKKNVTFYQIRFDFRDTEYKIETIEFNVTSKELADTIKLLVETYNETLRTAQIVSSQEYEAEYKEKVASGEWDWQEHDYDKHTYFYFARVGSDIGFCNFFMHERNKEEEERRAREEYENLTYEERKQLEEEQYQPYGGAFASWNDYWHWREG